MQSNKLYILTGPVQTGKTTRLIQWSLNRDDVFGILSPVINGERIFIDVKTGEQFKMEAEEAEKEILNVGKYIFSSATFSRAENILRKALNEKSGWIIVDEIGQLELTEKGFYTVVKEILSDKNENLKIVFVVRDSLLKKTINFFQIEDYKMFSI